MLISVRSGLPVAAHIVLLAVEVQVLHPWNAPRSGVGEQPYAQVMFIAEIDGCHVVVGHRAGPSGLRERRVVLGRISREMIFIADRVEYPDTVPARAPSAL